MRRKLVVVWSVALVVMVLLNQGFPNLVDLFPAAGQPRAYQITAALAWVIWLFGLMRLMRL